MQYTFKLCDNVYAQCGNLNKNGMILDSVKSGMDGVIRLTEQRENVLYRLEKIRVRHFICAE